MMTNTKTTHLHHHPLHHPLSAEMKLYNQILESNRVCREGLLLILASRRESEFDLSSSSDLVHGEVSEGDLDDIAEKSTFATSPQS